MDYYSVLGLFLILTFVIEFCDCIECENVLNVQYLDKETGWCRKCSRDCSPYIDVLPICRTICPGWLTLAPERTTTDTTFVSSPNTTPSVDTEPAVKTNENGQQGLKSQDLTITIVSSILVFVILLTLVLLLYFCYTRLHKNLKKLWTICIRNERRGNPDEFQSRTPVTPRRGSVQNENNFYHKSLECYTIEEEEENEDAHLSNSPTVSNISELYSNQSVLEATKVLKYSRTMGAIGPTGANVQIEPEVEIPPARDSCAQAPNLPAFPNTTTIENRDCQRITNRCNNNIDRNRWKYKETSKCCSNLQSNGDICERKTACDIVLSPEPSDPAYSAAGSPIVQEQSDDLNNETETIEKEIF